MIDPRLVVKPIKKAGGNQLNQVPVALIVFAQQHQMIGPLGLRAAILVIVRRHVHFAADDRLHPVGGGLVIEIRRCKEVAVIGHRHRGHAAPRGFLSEFPDLAGPIQQGIICVQM